MEWILAQTVNFNSQTVSFESHIGCVYIHFNILVLLRTSVLNSDFRVALWASSRARPKLYWLSHSLVLSFCHSTSISEDLYLSRWCFSLSMYQLIRGIAFFWADTVAGSQITYGTGGAQITTNSTRWKAWRKALPGKVGEAPRGGCIRAGVSEEQVQVC